MNDQPNNPHDDELLAALGDALPRVTPPAGLGDRIAAAAAGDAEGAAATAGGEGQGTPSAALPDGVVSLDAHRARRRTVWASLAAAACAAAVAVAITLSFAGGDPSQPTMPLTASAQVQPATRGPVTGTASLYAADAPAGQLRVSLHHVPTPPSGHHYEVWVLEKGSTEMTSVGSFTPGAPDVDLSLPLPAPARYAAVDISVQQDNGPPTHSGVSLAGATFT